MTISLDLVQEVPATKTPDFDIDKLGRGLNDFYSLQLLSHSSLPTSSLDSAKEVLGECTREQTR